MMPQTVLLALAMPAQTGRWTPTVQVGARPSSWPAQTQRPLVSSTSARTTAFGDTFSGGMLFAVVLFAATSCTCSVAPFVVHQTKADPRASEPGASCTLLEM
jgi:hypothetical protein